MHSVLEAAFWLVNLDQQIEISENGVQVFIQLYVYVLEHPKSVFDGY